MFHPYVIIESNLITGLFNTLIVCSGTTCLNAITNPQRNPPIPFKFMSKMYFASYVIAYVNTRTASVTAGYHMKSLPICVENDTIAKTFKNVNAPHCRSKYDLC